MRPLSNAALLEAWEAGLGQPNVERALSLLVAGVPEESPEALAELPIGARDARLLRLREVTFGERLPIVVSCPSCDEALEAELSASELVLPVAELPQGLGFRLPNSIDLVAVRGLEDPERALLQRCVEGDAGDPQQIAARMAEADPQSDLEIGLTCPSCGHAWSAPFDISSYFWSEVDAWAQRLLLEVHQLARGYGWSERDILSMSAPRRRAYLELLA